MDLVADMLAHHLKADHEYIFVEQLRPSIKSTLSSLPGVGPRPSLTNADRLFHRLVAYPSWLRKQVPHFDVFHVVDHSYSQLVHELPAGRTVVTCHDLDTFRCLLDAKIEKRSLPFRLMTKRIVSGLARASRISCVTQTVRDELLMRKLVQPERVTVVFNGVGQEFSPVADPQQDLKVKHLLNLDNASRYLLHVGSTIPRKRIDTLLHVFAHVRNSSPEIKLVRIGGPFTGAQMVLAKQLRVLDSIHVLPHIDRQTLAAVYRRAELLLLTSEAEGFGLPLVEAMACGCPVLASDLKVLHEIGGPAAEFCTVADTAAWSSKVDRVLRESTAAPDLWQSRRNRCIKQALRFSWKESASQFAQIYKALSIVPN